MFFTYKDYLPMEKSLPFEEMTKIHQQMMDEIGTDEDALELYAELIEQANRYLVFRASWELWTREERTERDAARTSCHNSLIVKFNQLSRYLKIQGKEAGWRDLLGYEEESTYNRKRIGDFASYLVFINCLNAR